MMRTLFSPIGTADPLTQLGDGPMLHIVRHCEPERVVLFLTPKMLTYQKRDGRYTRAIEMLCEAEGRSSPEMVLIESTYQDVFRFDHYIEEFEGILATLHGEFPDEPVLVNVSSGTPQMEQALVALGTFGRISLKLLQVVTPKADANEPDDRERPDTYDFDAMWEWNEELRSTDPKALASRIIEVQTPNFSERLLRENMVTLVKNYEYMAAFELGLSSRSIGEDSMRMIHAAADRLNLDGGLPAKVFAKSELAYRPNDLLGEYISVMGVRLEQGRWSDFVRSMTPALAEVSKVALRRAGLRESSYLIFENGRPTSELKWSAIDSDPRLRRALGPWAPGRKYITDEGLAKLVDEFYPDGEEKRKLRALREFEKKCRNPVTHELVNSSKSVLERIGGGLTLEKVMDYLVDLHGNVRRHLYKDISQAIIDTL